MFKRYVCSVALLAALTQVTSCSQSAKIESGSIVNPDVMSGVAATGAPIVNGKVKIKGSDNAAPVETETETDGSYSADIASLREPYLVQVESPSGDKLISVASKSALAQGKKINVTPLSHMIVANVFGTADADELFDSFEDAAAEFTEAKLEVQKQALFQKLVATGLIGSSGVVDSSVDLLNGDLLAGTSKGLDGLLDVIEVKTGSAKTTGIVLTLKGESTPIITDKVNAPDTTPVVSVAAQITQIKAQLSVLDQIREALNNFATFNTSKISCNGDPVDNASACGLDTLATQYKRYFHPDFKEDGFNRDQIVWDWFCVADDDHWITSKQDCKDNGKIDIESIVLKDVNLIKYDATSKEAIISLNVFIDGFLEGSEDFYMKLDSSDNKFKFVGNKKTFRYWIDSESLFQSNFNNNATPKQVDDYSVIVSMWYEGNGGHAFDGDEVFRMTALSGNAIFPGGENGSTSMNLYLVKAPVHDEQGQCSMGLAFSTTNKPYKISDSAGNISSATYAEACGTANACNGCNSQVGQDTPEDYTDDVYTWSYFDWESQRLNMTEALVMKMSKSERISLTSLSGVSGVSDEFIIRRPLVLTKFNAPSIVPTLSGLSVAQFCSGLSLTGSYNVSVGNGRLSDLSLYLSYHDSSYVWDNVTAREELHDTPKSSHSWVLDFELDPIPTGVQIPFAHLYMSSRDEQDRSFVRQISCAR
jgi:hypothetical protein